MRNGVSLMPASIYHRPLRRQVWRSAVFSRQKLFDNAGNWCFFVPVEHENHVCENTEARAGQWLHGQLGSLSSAVAIRRSDSRLGQRGNEIVNSKPINFRNSQIPGQSRVFCLLNRNQKNERQKHEQKPKTGPRHAGVASATQAGADRVRPETRFECGRFPPSAVALLQAACSLPRASGNGTRAA